MRFFRVLSLSYSQPASSSVSSPMPSAYSGVAISALFLLFAILILVLGAKTRFFARSDRLGHLVLVVGVAVGLMLQIALWTIFAVGYQNFGSFNPAASSVRRTTVLLLSRLTRLVFMAVLSFFVGMLGFAVLDVMGAATRKKKVALGLGLGMPSLVAMVYGLAMGIRASQVSAVFVYDASMPLLSVLSFVLAVVLTGFLLYVWRMVKGMGDTGPLAEERVRNAFMFAMVSVGLVAVFGVQLAMTFVYMYADGDYARNPRGAYNVATVVVIALAHLATAAAVLLYVFAPVWNGWVGKRSKEAGLKAPSSSSSSDSSVPLLRGDESSGTNVPSQYDV